jgi:hypothetical protein
VETFHDQVGYWLWEPATGTVFYALSIPRAQVAMAVGHAASSAKTFKLEAVRGSETNGIVSNPFLEHAFKTLRVTVEVTIHPDGTWSYEQDTVMAIPGARYASYDRVRVVQVRRRGIGAACIPRMAPLGGLAIASIGL